METWTITNIGPRTWKATRTFGPYTVAVGHGAYGGSWRIITAASILAQVDQLPTKSIEEAITVATAQIKALIDALAPFSALAAEAERLQAKVVALQIEAGSWRRQFDAARDALDARHAEAAHADEVVASTRALLTEAEGALARQAARIEALEAKVEADADSETIVRLKDYVQVQADEKRWIAEMRVWGPWDADREEGGQ